MRESQYKIYCCNDYDNALKCKIMELKNITVFRIIITNSILK